MKNYLALDITRQVLHKGSEISPEDKVKQK